VNQCVSAVRAVEMPVSVCLRRSCSLVTQAGGSLMFVRLALKVVMQNDGEIVDVNLLHVPYFKKLSLD
jgi:hypothetical protein